jgi:hypothetical protein
MTGYDGRQTTLGDFLNNSKLIARDSLGNVGRMAQKLEYCWDRNIFAFHLSQSFSKTIVGEREGGQKNCEDCFKNYLRDSISSIACACVRRTIPFII